MLKMKGGMHKDRGGGLGVPPGQLQRYGGKETPFESLSTGDEDEEDDDEEEGEIISSPPLETSPRLMTSSANRQESPCVPTG
jgi:hypothetical protein